jgi:glycosyltransferase involved in cell wall biosynthesis
MSPTVSVIVPVYNDSARLQKCLDALTNQTYPKADFEVIVVDNGSDESIEPVVKRFPQAKVLREVQPGSYASRNLGIAHAKGEIVAFTDADCIPAADWLEQGVAALQGTAGCGLVGGRVDVFYRDPDRPGSVELYDASRGFRQEKYIAIDHYGATANMFTFRTLFAELGVFDAGLKSYGDVEWGRRVAASGRGLVYADAAVVAHPARRTLRALSQRILRVVGGRHDMKQRNLYSRRDSATLASIPDTILSVWRDPRLRTIGQRSRVLGVIGFVQCVKLYEDCRLRLGGAPRR